MHTSPKVHIFLTRVLRSLPPIGVAVIVSPFFPLHILRVGFQLLGFLYPCCFCLFHFVGRLFLHPLFPGGSGVSVLYGCLVLSACISTASGLLCLFLRQNVRSHMLILVVVSPVANGHSICPSRTVRNFCGFHRVARACVLPSVVGWIWRGFPHLAP